MTTNFTAAQLVEMAVQDPTDIVGITDNASEYWFADAGGAGFFTVNGVVQPQGVWIAVPSSQLNSVIFTQADSIADFVDVTDENPAFSGFLYFPMVLSPSTVPPAPPPVIGIAPLDADKDNARSGSVPFTFTVTRSGENVQRHHHGDLDGQRHRQSTGRTRGFCRRPLPIWDRDPWPEPDVGGRYRQCARHDCGRTDRRILL